MALPKLDIPTYEIELPVSKTKVKFRPFLVKEQRNLLMALEANESSAIQQNVKDILYNCTLTEGIDVEKLPIVDVEFYFINLRAKSVGEIVESKYKCNNIVEEKECGNIMETEINLQNISVEMDEKISSEIKLTSQITVKLKYPEFGIVQDSLKYDSVAETTFNMIAKSIEYIYDGEQFYYSADATPEEMLEFVESMNQEQFVKIENFFNNLPKLKKNIEIDCNKCGFHHKIEIQGLENFFG